MFRWNYPNNRRRYNNFMRSTNMLLRPYWIGRALHGMYRVGRNVYNNYNRPFQRAGRSGGISASRFRLPYKRRFRKNYFRRR